MIRAVYDDGRYIFGFVIVKGTLGFPRVLTVQGLTARLRTAEPTRHGYRFYFDLDEFPIGFYMDSSQIRAADELHG